MNAIKDMRKLDCQKSNLILKLKTGTFGPAAAVFLISRGLLLGLLAFFRPDMLAQAPPGAYYTANPLWDPFILYDSEHYLRIAQQGYKEPVSAPFFPLYPLLIRLAGVLTKDLEAAGVVLAWCFFLGGLAAAKKLLLMKGQPQNDALWLLAFFPSSYFFSAAYTESLYFLLLTACLALAAARRWPLSLATASLLAVTRVSGGAVLALLIISYWLGERPGLKRAALSLASFLPLAAFLMHEQAVYGSFLAFSRALPLFHRYPSWPWHVIYHDLAHAKTNIIFLFNAFALLAAAVSAVAAKEGLWRAVILVHALLPLFTANVQPNLPYTHGYVRYILPVFPVFFGIGQLTAQKRWAFYGLFLLSCLLWTVFVCGTAGKSFLA